MIARPMLAAPATEAELRAMQFPVLLSAKLDGVRALCIERDGKPLLVSRKFIAIPNKHTQALFARPEFIGLDGELCVGPTNAKNLMQATTSGCMKVEGEPDVTWQVFDSFDMPTMEYAKRAAYAKSIVGKLTYQCPQAAWLSQFHITGYDALLANEEKFLAEGYEGAIVRSPTGPYKQGRSTVKQGWLLKVKRFQDSEAEVIDTYELETNTNEAIQDELGYTKRSSHVAGKTGIGILGGCVVRDCKTGVVFQIGTGWTREQRTNLWKGRQFLIGKILTYKHFSIGVVDKPRFPIFKAWRDRRDT